MKGRRFVKILFFVLALLIGISLFAFLKQQGEIDGFNRPPLEISQIEDGVYHGE